MLSNDWIAPQQAFEHSDMFPDPDAAYAEAKAWHDAQEQKQVSKLTEVPDDAEDGGNPEDDDE